MSQRRQSGGCGRCGGKTLNAEFRDAQSCQHLQRGARAAGLAEAAAAAAAAEAAAAAAHGSKSALRLSVTNSVGRDKGSCERWATPGWVVRLPLPSIQGLRAGTNSSPLGGGHGPGAREGPDRLRPLSEGIGGGAASRLRRFGRVSSEAF